MKTKSIEDYKKQILGYAGDKFLGNLGGQLEKKAESNITVNLVKVTPEIASEYLRFNLNNRKPNEKNVRFLANQMKSGLFLENGESIVFDKFGVLKDGQHRLLAIIKSGNSYHIPIVRGVDPISMSTYDTGRGRTASDVLSLNGYQYSTQIAPLIKLIYKYKISGSKSREAKSTHKVETLTNHQVLSFCNENYDWLKNIVKTSMNLVSKSKPIVLNSSQVSIISYLIGGENPSDYVVDFMKHVCGVNKTDSTATSYLYNKLYNSKVNKEPLNFYWIIGMCIKAWNYYIDGNPSVKYFRFSTDQELPIINK